MKLHEVNYPDGSKFSVNADKKGNVYMNIYEGDVRDKNAHSHDCYQISGDLKDDKAYKGGHEKRSDKR